jgi:hypothetical protein
MNKMLNILGRILKGAGDASTGGLVSAVVNAKASPDGGKGKHDIPKIAGYVMMGFIIFGVIFKDLDPETAEQLMKMIARFGFWS